MPFHVDNNESSSEESSREGDCANPDDDSIFRPRRSTILAKMLKYNYDSAPANTTGSSQHYWIIYQDNAKATAVRKLPQRGPGKLSFWIFYAALKTNSYKKKFR